MVSVVFGRRGSGKSTLGRELLRRQAAAAGKIGIMLDTLLEHSDLPLVDLDNLGWILAGRHRPIVRVHVPDLGRFDDLRDVLSKRPPGYEPGVVLAIDEISYWSKPNQTAPALSDLIRYGRHWHVDLIGIARRAAETSREFTSQADEFYIFATHEPRDLAYFAEILAPEAMAKIGHIEKYHYIRYSIDGTWTVEPPVLI